MAESRPKIRYVNIQQIEIDGTLALHISDPCHISQPMSAPPEMLLALHLMDGRHTIGGIAQVYRTHKAIIDESLIEYLVNFLDENGYLENEKFSAMLGEVVFSKTRPLVHTNNLLSREEFEQKYAETSARLGIANLEKTDRNLKGLIAPHIDFLRGFDSYVEAYARLEGVDAQVFVIIGTSHAPLSSLYAYTSQTFATLHEDAIVDEEFLDSLKNGIPGNILSEDRLNHHVEHSIEFQAVFLKYLLKDRDFKIVPILCNSLHESIDKQNDCPPAEVYLFCDKLRDTIARCGKKVAIVCGADLAHKGRIFDEEIELSKEFVSNIETRDIEALSNAKNIDANGFFRHFTEDRNARNVCSVAGIFTTLRTVTASRGEISSYRQFIDKGEGNYLISFCGMALYE
ncbi:MAG: AmmeMemoRadiSam system protein B [Planctomycetes bacterium]|nr:AmmeMemoRadiSam system protein B [Planctomycetota bacterium]